MVDGKATIIIVFLWICAAAAADIQERDLAALCPTTIGNMIYSSLLPASCGVEKRRCRKENGKNIFIFLEGASHGWVVYNLFDDVSCQSNQKRDFVLFILVSLFFH